jgi:hypothetical protein
MEAAEAQVRKDGTFELLKTIPIQTLKMTTAIVAQRLIELCSAGKFLEAQEELYHQDIISIETDGVRTLGAANMHQKEEQFLSRVARMDVISYSDILVAGSYFSVVLHMEMELKGVGNMSIDEVCVYQVKEGKIVFEQFFRD